MNQAIENLNSGMLFIVSRTSPDQSIEGPESPSHPVWTTFHDVGSGVAISLLGLTFIFTVYLVYWLTNRRK